MGTLIGLTRRLKWFILALATPLLAVFNYFGGRLGLSADLPDSEMLTGAVLVNDLFNGGSLSDWSLTEAPYVIPDWPLFALIHVAGVGPYETVLLFFSLQLALLACAWWLVAPWLATNTNWRRGAFGGVLLVTLFATLRISPFYFALVSYWRFGTVILVVACLGLTLRWLFGESQRMRSVALFWLGVLLFMSHVSDEMIVVWFTVPAAVAVIFVFWTEARPARSIAPWMAVIAASHALGFLVEGRFTQSVPYQAGFSFHGVGSRLGQLYEILRVVASGNPIAAAVVVGTLFAAMATLFDRPRTHLRRGGWATDEPEMAGQRFWAVYLVVAVAVSGLAQIMVVGVPLGIRYSMIFFFLAALYAGISASEIVTFLATQLRDHLHYRSLKFASAGFSVAFLLSVVTAGDAGGYDLRRTLPEVDCVDDALELVGAEIGLSHYKTTNLVMFYGKFDQRITPYWYSEGRLQRTPWPRNITWDRDTFDFAISENVGFQPGLSVENIVEVVGPPISQTDCGRFSVLYYGPDGIDLSTSRG